MARGCIYCITKSEYDDVSFNESNYYDKLDALNIDYVSDENEINSKPALEYLLEMMYDLGAIIGYGQFHGHYTFSFYFSDAKKAKTQHFKPKFEELTKRVYALTLEDVIYQTPALDCIVNDNCNDLINLCTQDGEFDITVDDFIRQIESGVMYYVYDRIILMH